MTDVYDRALAAFNEIMLADDPGHVPTPPQPTDKTYRVVGEQPMVIDGVSYNTGETFTTTFGFEQEADYIKFGQLEEVTDVEEPSQVEEPVSPDSETLEETDTEVKES
jgi:hypothetical protein